MNRFKLSDRTKEELLQDLENQQHWQTMFDYMNYFGFYKNKPGTENNKFFETRYDLQLQIEYTKANK
jgi:hypothetical protein